MGYLEETNQEDVGDEGFSCSIPVANSDQELLLPISRTDAFSPSTEYQDGDGDSFSTPGGEDDDEDQEELEMDCSAKSYCLVGLGVTFMLMFVVAVISVVVVLVAAPIYVSHESSSTTDDIPSSFSSCLEVREYYHSSKLPLSDGYYHLHVRSDAHSQMVEFKVYCQGMDTHEPKEYLDVKPERNTGGRFTQQQQQAGDDEDHIVFSDSVMQYERIRYLPTKLALDPSDDLFASYVTSSSSSSSSPVYHSLSLPLGKLSHCITPSTLLEDPLVHSQEHQVSIDVSRTAFNLSTKNTVTATVDNTSTSATTTSGDGWSAEYSREGSMVLLRPIQGWCGELEYGSLQEDGSRLILLSL